MSVLKRGLIKVKLWRRLQSFKSKFCNLISGLSLFKKGKLKLRLSVFFLKSQAAQNHTFSMLQV